jgi:hypothetical protein
MPEATRTGLARALSAPRPSDDLLPKKPARSPDERDQQYHADEEDEQLTPQSESFTDARTSTSHPRMTAPNAMRMKNVIPPNT